MIKGLRGAQLRPRAGRVAKKHRPGERKTPCPKCAARLLEKEKQQQQQQL